MKPSAGGRPVFLVGFMGAGKSAVGRALATAWGWDFVDTDGVVEARAGMAIEEIFRRHGEGRFREMEWEALRALEGARRVVVATGGGLFVGIPQRSFVRREGTSVWLDVPLGVASDRGGARGRPLWRGDDPIALRAFFERRRAAYALADVHVDAGADGAEEVAARVARAFHR